MSIASGYKKFKKYILTSSGFQLVSHWTKANTLEFDDGKTAQDKLGAIDGISSSRESNSDKIAASTALVSELNSDLAGYKFGTTSDGKPGYIIPGGADTVIPFKGNCVLAYSKMFSPIAGSSEKIFICKIGDILIKADDINNDLDSSNLEFSGGCSFKTLFSNSMSSHYRTTRFVVYQCTKAGELTVRFPITAEYHHSSIAIIRT